MTLSAFTPLTVKGLLLYEQTILFGFCLFLISFFHVLAVKSPPVWLSAPPAEPPKQAETKRCVPPTMMAMHKLVPKEEVAPVLFPGKHNTARYIQQITGTSK